MTKLNPVYAPPGYDPTREEFPLTRAGCGGFVIMALLIVALATDGLAFVLGRQTPAKADGLPTLAQVPSSTSSPTPNTVRTAYVRAYLTSLPPIPSATNTPTPTITFTASPGPSPTASKTPTRTPTATHRPTATRRPARPAPRTSGGGNESQPPAADNPQNPPPQVMRIITVWAPPIAATCCKPLEPMYTWTPTAAPTLPAPTATIPPSTTPIPPSATVSPIPPSPSQVPTQIPATATNLPTSTPIPPTVTLQPTATTRPTDEAATK